MAIVALNDEYLTDIADSIRTKLGVQTTYKPSEMAEAIESISGGGITPTGTISITANDTYDVTQYASAEVNVPTGGITPTGTKQISKTQNGTTTEDVTNYASAEITVNVPNSYAQSDEGKVVSNGALVAQTSDTVTANDTYDTTLINSLTVNVSGGSGVNQKSGTITFDSESQSTVQITTLAEIGFTPSKFYFYVKDYADMAGKTNALVEALYELKGTPQYSLKASIRLNASSARVGSVSPGAFTDSNTTFLKLNGTTVEFICNSSFKVPGNVIYEWLAIE